MRTFDRSLTDDKYLVLPSQKLLSFEKQGLSLTGEFAVAVRDYKSLPLVLDVHDEVLNISKLKGITSIRAKVGEFDDQPWNNGDSVAKYCSKYWAEYCKNAKDAGLTIDGYFFENPSFSRGWNWGWPNDADPRIQILRRQIPITDVRTPRILWVDVERWWESYDEWYANKATAVHIAGSMINKSCADFLVRIRQDQKAGNLPPFELGIYTSPGFVKEYSPDLDATLQWYLQWIATYSYAMEKILPTIKSMDDLRARAIPIQGSQPLELGNKRADSWQYGGNLVFADGAVTDRKTGLPCGVDISIDLNPDAFDYGVTPPPVIIPDPDPTPIPVPVTTYYALIAKEVSGLKLRSVKAVGAANIANIIDMDFHPIVKVKLLGKPVTEGDITWAAMSWAGETAYFATKQGVWPDYATVTSETK